MKNVNWKLVSIVIISLFVLSTIAGACPVNAAVATAIPGYLEKIVASGLYGPHCIAFDKTGNLYVANEGYTAPPDYLPGTTITKITPDGQVSTFANGFVGPAGIAFDKQGNLWVGDDGHTYPGDGLGYNIWKIAPDGTVTPGSSFLFDNPNTLAFDKDWNLFVAATGGDIWKIGKNGVVTHFAGGFSVPQAIAFDKKGNVYTCDDDGTIWKLNPSGSTRAIFAKIDGNHGNFAFGKDENLYAPDNAGKVMVISPSGETKIFVNGLSWSRGVAFDSKGDLYASDYNLGFVWKISENKQKVVFTDEFKKADLKEWTTVLGTWTVESGKLAQNDPNPGGDWPTRPAIVADCIVEESFRIEAKFNQLSHEDPNPGSLAFLFRYQNMRNTLFVIFHGGTNAIIGKVVDGIETNNWYSCPYSLDAEHTAAIEVDGAKIDLYLDGVLVASDDNWGSAYSSGRIGFDTWYTAAKFDDVIVSGNVYMAPTKVHVYPGESIQAAIDEAAKAGTVIVHAGTYHEKVFVDKPLTLKGDDAIIDLDGVSFPPNEPFNAGIYVDAPCVTVSGFTIKNVPYYPPPVVLPYAFGIVFVGSSSNGLIENNIVDSQYMGIGVTSNYDTAEVDYPEISDVEVQNNQISAVFGIWIINSNNVAIHDNQVTALTNPDYPTQLCAGISVLQFTRNGLTPVMEGAYIRNNIINSECTGIQVSGNTATGGMTKVEVINNIVNMEPLIVQYPNTNPVGGINLGNAPSAVVRGNEVHVQTSWLTMSSVQVLGIRLTGISNNALVENNDVTSDYAGIRLNGPSDVTIQNNEVLAAVNPIDTTGPASNFVIRKNVLTATTNWRAKGVWGLSPTGILLQGSYSGGTIENNIINSENVGISFAGQANIVINKNAIASATNVMASNSPNLVINNNDLTAKANPLYTNPPAPNGILLSGELSNCMITNNNIDSERFGIWISAIGSTQNIQILENKVSSVTSISIDRPADPNPLNLLINGNTLSAKNITTVNPIITAYGITLNGGFSEGTISNNKIESDHYGISLNGQSNIAISENNIDANVAISANSGNSFTITGNTLNADTWGIRLMQMGNTPVIIRSNDITCGATAIFVNRVMNSFIQNNHVQVVGGILPINGGITINGGTGNSISDNTVKGDFNYGITIGTGAGVVDSSFNSITGNKIVGGAKIPDYAFWFLPSAHDNTATSNTVSDVYLETLDDSITIPSNNLVYGNTVKLDFKLNQKYSDEFKNKNLDEKWFFINPDDDNPSGQYYSLETNSGFLTLTTTGVTDIFGQDTAPRIMQIAPIGDFQIVLHLKADINPAILYEHAGILIYTNLGNWVRLLRDSNLNSIYLQSATGAWIAAPFSGSDVTLRLTKVGDSYQGEYSMDGVNFVFVGTTNPNPFNPILIGFNVADTVYGDVFSAAFDYFRVYTIDMNPEPKMKIVFKDDFSQTGVEDWTTVFGTWAVQNGKLTQNDPSAGSAPEWTRRPAIVADCTVNDNFRIETKFSHTQGSIAALFRYQEDIRNTEYVIFHGGTNIIIGATVQGEERSEWFNYQYSLGTEHTTAIEVRDSIVLVYVDGVLAAFDDVSDRGFVYSTGRIGFDTWFTPAKFDEVKVSTD
jgi:parallel beta-helix repeat protein